MWEGLSREEPATWPLAPACSAHSDEPGVLGQAPEPGIGVTQRPLPCHGRQDSLIMWITLDNIPLRNFSICI